MCKNTRFYYFSDLYHDDIGIPPATTFHYTAAECRPILWQYDGEVHTNFYLGVGDKISKVYKFRDEFTMHGPN